jgi:hypothetical protein
MGEIVDEIRSVRYAGGWKAKALAGPGRRTGPRAPARGGRVVENGMKRNAVRIHPSDNVITLLVDVAAGERASWGGSAWIATRENIPEGHKAALGDIPRGEPVRKYGHPIGTAGRDIAAGEHVHTHNLARDEG